MRGLLPASVAFAALAATGSAQPAAGAAGQAPQPPVFDVSVDMVAVDVRVVEPNGRPALGLLPGDFALKVDGRPRHVVSVEYVGADDAPAAPAPEPASLVPTPPVSTGFSTNEGVRAGRMVLLAIDTGNISAGGGRGVVRSADKLLDQLTPADRLGLVTIPGPGPSVEFTGEHARVREALKQVVGRAPMVRESVPLPDAIAYVERDTFRWEQFLASQCGSERSDRDTQLCIARMEAEARQVAVDWRDRARASTEALKALLRGLRGVEGPKALVLVTEGIGSERADVKQLAELAAEAQVTLYLVLIERPGVDITRMGPSLENAETRDLEQGSIYGLAASSRGAVFRAGGSAEGIFERIAGELRGYYLLGFEPEGGDRDGKGHRIDVVVARERVTVRARGLLNIPTSAPNDQAVIASLLRSPFLERGLTLRVATLALPDRETGKLRIVVTGDAAGASRPLTVGMALITPDGRTEKAVGYSGIDAQAGQRSLFVGELSAGPGAYTLRLAVRDAAGRRGSVHHAVRAALVSAAGLEVSDLVLAPASSAGSALPAVDTELTTGALAAKLELRAGDAGRLESAAVALEIADAADGPALVAVPARVGAAERGVREAQAVVSAGLLPPGAYFARAVVSAGTERAAVLLRPFRIVASAAGPSPAAGATAGTGPLALPPPAFERAELLRPAVLGPLLETVTRGEPVPAAIAAALALARQGAPEKMLDALGRETKPDARIALLRGVSLYAAGVVPGAITQLQAALGLRSDLFAAAVYLGACYAASGEDANAVGAWNTALIGETASPVLFGVLADALLRTGEAGQAVDTLQEGLGSWPDDADLRHRLGLAYAASGRRDEAMPLLTAWIDAHPEDQATAFATLTLLFQGFAAERAGAAAVGDRERLVRYARAYVDGKGANRALVSRWLAYLEKK